VQQSCDHIFEKLVASLGEGGSGTEPRAFLPDGSSLRAAHSPALCRLYPPGANQNGEGHWPVLRLLAAHDLRSGLAMRPEWGPDQGRGGMQTLSGDKVGIRSDRNEQPVTRGQGQE
jgi:hypothetical protein